MKKPVNILTNHEILSEVENYKNSIIANKKYEKTFIIVTILFLLIASISLVFVFIFPDQEIPFKKDDSSEKKIAWSFIISILVSFTILIVCIPLTCIWFYKTHQRVQVHMPIILTGKTIDNCSIIVGIFNFITAIMASMAPIFWGLMDFDNKKDWAWYTDTKVIVYIFMCSLIFLFWSIIIPILQDKISRKDVEYFNRYALFQYEKIPQYLSHLENVFKKRAAFFNKKLKTKKLTKSEKNSIINRPIFPWEDFSYDVRRIYKGWTCKYGDEYQIIKYCLFVEIFTFIHKDEIEKRNIKNFVDKFLKVKNNEEIRKFNKKFLNKF